MALLSSRMQMPSMRGECRCGSACTLRGECPTHTLPTPALHTQPKHMPLILTCTHLRTRSACSCHALQACSCAGPR